jgi:histidine triad (HIT) family protein
VIDDVFCKILNKELPADIVMETEEWIAINDIHPQAPVHILIFPKEHIGTLQSAGEQHAELLGKLVLAANQVAEKTGVAEKGFRVIINQGDHGGQLVPHLHVHVLGGRRLGAKVVKED